MADAVRIVATAPVPDVALQLFEELGDVVVAEPPDRALIASADVLIVRSTSVDEELLGQASRLRAIVRTGAGLDKIDVAAASRRRVPVLYAPDAGTRPVAEGTLALILAASKRLGELQAVLAEGRWDERYAYVPRDVAGATLGIVGLGRIGSAVARLAQAIGMLVIAYEPYPDASADADLPVRTVGLGRLFEESDVISLHCSLNESTRGLIDRSLLASAKPGAILVNASRGGLVTDDALLVEALDRGWLSAVGVDVFTNEPPDPTDPLVSHPRVVCTPHTVGLTQAWNERVFGSLARDLGLLLAGERPVNLANPEAFRPLTGSAGS
jgi:phosphoglycerate dehydrogenase-like enzyme